MKPITFLIAMSMGLLFMSCKTTTYVISGDAKQQIKTEDGHTTIQIMNEYHVSESHGHDSGGVLADDSEINYINSLLLKTKERYALPYDQVILLEEYVEDSTEKIEYALKAVDGEPDSIRFEYNNPSPSKIRINFIPFSQHPQYILDGTLRVAFGVMELEKIVSGEPHDTASKSVLINMPSNSNPLQGMEFIIEGSDFDYKHNHTDEGLMRKDKHRNWHYTDDPRKGN